MMVQRKKQDVEDAILAAAFQLFTGKGYSETTVPAIARAARISNANIYVYFKSKLEILHKLYEPWLIEHLDKLDHALAKAVDPRSRLRKMLTVLWRELPQANNGFAHNLIEAASSSQPDYDPRLRDYLIARVRGWLEATDALEGTRLADMTVMMVMAFDGFAANVRREHGLVCSDEMIDRFCDLVLGGADRPAAASLPENPSVPARRRLKRSASRFRR